MTASFAAGNALSLLVGVSDVGGYLPAYPSEDVLLVQEIAPGTPSELLAHRPDIQAAEHRLRARNADIGAARAAFFPRISLTGMFGSSSADLSNLFDSGQRAWSFAPQISVPIFSGGRNRANLDLAEVRKDMAVAGYERPSRPRSARSPMRWRRPTRCAARNWRSAPGRQQPEAMRLAEARYRGGVDGYLRYRTRSDMHC